MSIWDYDANFANNPLVRLVPNSLEKELWVKVLVREDIADKIKVERVSLKGYF